MARAIPFDGYNREFEMAPYDEGDPWPAMEPMPAYNSQVLTFTRWKLSDDELAEINRTGEVWMAARTGRRPMQPHWLGSLSYIKWACAELGGLWNPTKPAAPDQGEENIEPA